MKKFFALLLSLALVATMTACGSKTDSTGNNSDANAETITSDKPVKWDFVVINSLTHPSSVLCQEFADSIMEKSGGRIEITVRAPGELSYNAADYLVAVGDGSVQMADVGSNCFGVLKAGALPCLPYIASDLDEFDKVMSVVEPTLKEELAEYGAKYLFYYTWPAQSLWTKNKELKSLYDVKGLKIRTINNELSALVQQLGGTPVSLAGSEVPTGLQTGVVDGVITSAYGLGGAGWDDSLNYGLLADCQIIPDYMCMNQAEYDALPENLQKVIDEVCEEFQAKMCETMFADEDTWRTDLESEGMVLNTADENESAQITADMQNYWDSWCEERGGNTAELLKQVRTELNK